MISSPLYHDMVTSVIHHDASLVMDIIRSSKLLWVRRSLKTRTKDGERKGGLFADDRWIVLSRAEVPLRSRFNMDENCTAYVHVDAAWKLNTGHKIYHEIKTGNFDLYEDIYLKYRGKRPAASWDGDDPNMYSERCMTTEHPLIIWKWNKITPTFTGGHEALDYIQHKLRIGALRVLPLDLIAPLVQAKLRRMGRTDEMPDDHFIGPFSED